MRMFVGILFVAILVLALVILIIVQMVSRKNLGLPLPSRNPTVSQLITNYVPVVFATFLKPFWLMSNRLLCIFRPFEKLRTADAKPSKSIKLKYTSLPPQMVILWALRARHSLLVAVCAIGLSANMMSVALGGLFQNDVSLVTYNGTFTSQYSPMIDQNMLEYNRSDACYVAKADISHGTNPPPWIRRENYFLPFTTVPDLSHDDNTTTYKAVTQRFGVTMSCFLADCNSTISTIAWTGDSGSATIPVVVPQQLSQGPQVSCDNPNLAAEGSQNNSNAALEALQTLASSTKSTEADPDAICDTLLLSGFLRANRTVSVDNIRTDNSGNLEDYFPTIISINSFSSLWMVRQPTVHTAPYSVTVDRNGRVQAYVQAGPEANEPDQFFSNGSNLASLVQQRRSHCVTTSLYWHNDTIPDNWFGYFVKAPSNATSFVDPELPVPAFDAIAPRAYH